MASKRKRAPGAGRPPKVRGYIVLSVRMPAKSLDELRLHAAMRGLSMSDLAREVLLDWASQQPARASVKRLVAASATVVAGSTRATRRRS